MNEYSESAPGLMQLDQQLLKVFGGYKKVKWAVRIAGIMVAVGYGLMVTGQTLLRSVPVLAMLLQNMPFLAILAIYVCYFVALGITIRHGFLVKKYRETLAIYDLATTSMFERAVAGYKQAKKKAISRGLMAISPILLLVLLFGMLFVAKGGFH